MDSFLASVLYTMGAFAFTAAFFILGIILLIKLWVMTNDVSKIRQLMEMGMGVKYDEIDPDADLDFENDGTNKSEFWQLNKLPFYKKKQYKYRDDSAKNSEKLNDN